MYGLYQIVYYTVFDILKTLMSPFFLVIGLIIFFQYKRVGSSALKGTIISIVYGIFGGIIVTVSLIYLEVYIFPLDFFYILIISLILSLVDTRFVCLSYGGSIVVLANLIWSYPRVNSYEIMVVVAILHIVESFLIFLNGKAQATTNYFNMDQKIVGGLVFNRFWPIPFVVFIGNIMIRPVTLIAILNYADFTISKSSSRKSRETAFSLFIYSSLLLAITIMSRNEFISPIFAIIGHEFILFINKYREKTSLPLYSDVAKGVRVLEIEPRSIAHRMGIRPGDIVFRINNIRVLNDEDLENVMAINNKILKIEYFSPSKGVRVKEYKGKIKTLGLVTFPKVEY